MRRFTAAEPAPAASGSRNHARPARGDWQVIKSLLPYLLEFRARVALALSCLVLAKVANLGVPILMKHIVDALGPVAALSAAARASADPSLIVVGGLGLLVIAYGLVRLSTSLFT